jgi:uncharacterized membrane protein YgcG
MNPEAGMTRRDRRQLTLGLLGFFLLAVGIFAIPAAMLEPLREKQVALEEEIGLIRIDGGIPPGLRMGASIPIILGGQCVGESCAYEQQPDWVSVAADASTNAWSLYPPLYPNESVHVCSLVTLAALGFSDASAGGYSLYCWRGANTIGPDGGYVFTDYQGGQATLQGSQYGSSPQMTGASATLVECWPDGGSGSHTLCAQVYCPDGCSAGVYESVSKRKAPPYDGGGSSGGSSSGGSSSGSSSGGSSSGGSSSGGAADGGAFVSVVPDFISANGGPSVTATCSGTPTCAGATAVTVDGVAGTITGTSSTSVTFTPPASTVSSTDGNPSASTVLVTTASGAVIRSTGVPLNKVHYLPAFVGVSHAAAWTAEVVNLDGGFIASVPDLSGNGYTLTTGPSDTPPAYTSTGGGVGGQLPYWTESGTYNNRLVNASYPAITGGTVEFVGAYRFTGGSLGANVGNVLASLGPATSGELYFDGTDINQYSGNLVNLVAPTLNQDESLLSYLTGSTSSYQILNGGSPVTGGNPGGSNSTGGICIGGKYDTTPFGVEGLYYTWLIYPAVTSSTGDTNLEGYFSAEGLH